MEEIYGPDPVQTAGCELWMSDGYCLCAEPDLVQAEPWVFAGRAGGPVTCAECGGLV